MKLTLRQGRRLEREIETTITRVLQEGVKLRNVAITAYQDFDSSVKATNELAMATIEITNRLNGIRFGVRRKIQMVHESNGLSDLITEEAMLKRQLQMLGALLIPEFTEHEQHVAKARHAATKNADSVANAYGQQNDQIVLGTIAVKSTVDAAKNTRKTIEKRLRAIGDLSAQLNSAGNIEVLDVDVEFLEAQGIVV
jgi:hypothetical protein